MGDQSFGLLLTWTTYGTWLPGDPRGHASKVFDTQSGYQPRRNLPGTPYAADDLPTRELARSLQKFPTVWLTKPQAFLVAVALLDATDVRTWRIARAAVMAGHVHVVIVDCPSDAAVVRRVLKGTSQAALSREAGKSHRWWTRHGSDRYLHGERSILAAARYVERQANRLAAIRDGRIVEC